MSTYPASLYAQTRERVMSSAEVVAPVLHAMFKPATVLDVGCGEGHWMAEFHRHRCTVAGIDAPHVTLERGSFHAQDLEQPIALSGSNDIVLCLEVAEHLSPERADGFVAELCALGKTIIFSAAIPGQGGAGHVNEQHTPYWVEKFTAHGYEGTGALRTLFWDDERVQPWYRQNLLVFGDLGPLAPDGCPALVHPEIWGWYRP